MGDRPLPKLKGMGLSNTISSRLAGLLIGLLAALLVIVALAPAVSASSSIHIVVAVTTVVFGSEDDVVELASEDVPEEFQGQTCTVKAVSQNQVSVHPDNDLRVVSGGSSVLLKDVEAVLGGTVEADGTLVLGSEIVVSLLLGPDGVFSAGIEIEVDCTPPVTTTIEATTTTTIEDIVSPTSIVSSTTTIVGTTTTIVATTADVSPETLPFTGFENGTTGLLALVLVASGALALVGTRVFRRETDE